ncbi:MAG: hypothetical protein ACYSU0_11645 [Planctomycetota bacterium]
MRQSPISPIRRCRWLGLALLLGVAAPAMARQDRDARSYQNLARRGYGLSPREIGNSLGHLARRDPTRMSFSDEFALHYYSKQWGRVGGMLRQMPEGDAAAVYSKILKDLTTRERPAMLMDDVLGLIDAAPGELSGTWIRQLGVLVKVVIIPEEQWMLGDKLDKGTRLIGGRDPARRLVAGRILMQTPFSEIAVRFLPTVEEARQLEDEAVRAEVLKYLEAKKQADRVRDAELSQTLSREFAALLDSSASAQKRQQQVGRLAWKLDEVTPDMLIAVVKRLLADDKELAASFMLSACDKMGHTARHQHKGELRTRNARFLAALGDLVSREVDTKDPIWSSVLTTMADIWLQEAETTLSRRPEYEKRKGDGRERSFARPQELVAVAPRGRWRAVLPAGYGERIDLVLPRLVMMCADPDQAIPQIVEINKRNPKGAALLAQDFVRRWAELHNPEIPEAVRQRYKLPRGSAIVVTPLMIEKNIQGLARIMRLLSESKILPDDYARIVDAFDRCYGNAEVYRVGHIEKVFGAVESMDAKLFGALTGKMADGLGKRWRQMTVQESALTTRGQQEVLLMVRSGYGDLLKMIDTRVAAHPADWRALSVGGTVLSDWGDYEYFQELAKASDHDRMFRYKEKNNLAQGYFKRAAQAYVKEASAKKRPPVVLGPFLAWFNSILGLNSNGEINLSKAMNRRALTQMRDLMRGLPGKTAQAHVDAFAEYVDTRMESKRSPLPAELKYKFLASGLVITADSPFASDARKQVEYFEDLLREVRLETRVDGPNTIWRQEDFGIIISLVHTDAMGRMINLEKYLKLKAPSKRVSGQTIRKMSSVKSARNEFEKNIIESLTRFFEIKSILFSARDVLPRPDGKPGWSETVLAYAQVRAKGISVDRIPPVELNLQFYDLSGPVTIPVTSAETMIQMTGKKTTKRPVSNVQITQTLDTRQLFVSGRLALNVVASGNGLMPELEDLVDLHGLKQVLPVKRIEPGEGALIKNLHSWSDKVQVTSDRQWSIVLDSTCVREAEGLVEVPFPTIGRPVGGEGDATGAVVIAPPPANYGLWVGLVVLVLAVAGVAAFLIYRKVNRGERPVRAGDVFHMPEQVDAFVVPQLLRSLAASNLVEMSSEDRAEMQADLRQVQEAAFDPNGDQPTKDELRKLAGKWLEKACG